MYTVTISTAPCLLTGMSQRLITHHPKNGAYTELFAGLSPTITEQNNGGWSRFCLSL